MVADIIMADTIVVVIITTMVVDLEVGTTTIADTDTITDVVIAHRWDTMVIIKTKNNIRTDTAIRKIETIAMMETDTTRIREINAILTRKIEVIQKIKTDAIQTAILKEIDLEIRQIIIEEPKVLGALMSEHIIPVHEDKYSNV